MKIYAAHHFFGRYRLYELRKGYNVHYWHSLGFLGVQTLPELDGPIFDIKRPGGQVQEGDLECEFSPP